MADNDLPFELDAEIRAAIGGAFESHNFLTVGYLGEDGWPHLSHRGTAQVFGPQQFAIWVRRRDDGLAKAMAVRPQVTLFYVDMSVPQLYTFYGRGQVSTDEDVDNRVYSSARRRRRRRADARPPTATARHSAGCKRRQLAIRSPRRCPRSPSSEGPPVRTGLS